jgi:hypothetical protein
MEQRNYAHVNNKPEIFAPSVIPCLYRLDWHLMEMAVALWTSGRHTTAVGKLNTTKW